MGATDFDVQLLNYRDNFNGLFFLMAWGSLRFSDAQPMDLNKNLHHESTVRGIIWRSKTSFSGMPVAIAAEGFLSKGSHNWLWKFLTVLDTILHESGAQDVDFFASSHG